jgi:hypothetical protein
MFGSKPKRTRTKKTVDEKIKEFAGKALIKAMKEDPEVVRQYVKQQYGIEIRTQGERMISQVVEQAKVRVIMKVADDIMEDPEVQDALRDKLVAELLGISPHQPRAKEERSQTRGNYRSQMDKILYDINKLEQLKERLGVNNSGWSKVLQNPEVFKAGLGLIQGLMGSSGLTPVTTPADSGERMYAVEKDGPKLPKASQTAPGQKEPTDKSVAAKGNLVSWLPPIASSAKTP